MRLGVARAVVGSELVEGDIEVTEGVISEVGLAPAGNGLAVPGFVDLHVHGHGGVDFVDATPEDHGEIARALTAYGVTSYLPTLMSLPVDDLVDAISRHPGSVAGGAKAHGFHLEGPFLSPEESGAHRLDALAAPSRESIDRLLSAGPVAHMTMAPDLDGALEAIAHLTDSGVVVSLGHSAATAESTHEALDQGASVFTHVFNAMGPLSQREPGILGVALARDDVFLTAIFDRVHFSDEVARVIISCAGERLVSISDGTAAIGAGDSAILGNTPTEIVDGAPRLPGGVIAGSVLTLDTAFRNLIGLGVDMVSAARASATTPARAGRLAGVGEIAVGAAADLVVLDDSHQVKRTYVDGVQVFES